MLAMPLNSLNNFWTLDASLIFLSKTLTPPLELLNIHSFQKKLQQMFLGTSTRYKSQFESQDVWQTAKYPKPIACLAKNKLQE